MEFLKEVSAVFTLHVPTPKVYCKMFEDNNSFIALAESHKKGELQKTLASPPESMAFRLKTSQLGCEYVAGG